MPKPIEDQYFNWLCQKVSVPSARLPNLRFNNLLSTLHQFQFVFLVSGDDNRVEDGRDLRIEFLRQRGFPIDGALTSPGCSVLEMLIAFSRVAEFETDESAKNWFWVMLTNLGLSTVNDATPINEKALHDVIEQFVFRTYNRRGHGGLFPLTHTKKDQREVEIWYQFNEYLFELDYD